MLANTRLTLTRLTQPENPRYVDSPSKVSMMPQLSDWCASNPNLCAWDGGCGVRYRACACTAIVASKWASMQVGLGERSWGEAHLIEAQREYRDPTEALELEQLHRGRAEPVHGPG